MLVEERLVISFKIKKQDILNVSLIHEEFCISEKLCVFNIWRFHRRMGGIREKRQNDLSHGNVNRDASS